MCCDTAVPQLVAAAQAGDDRAYDELARRYRPGVYALCFDRTRRFDIAEDLTQEALLRAHRGLGGLQDPSAFPAWLRKIALNVCLAWLRRPAPQLADLDAVREQLLVEDAAEQALRRWLARRIARAVSELPESNRLALLMHLQGSSSREIAEFVGVPESTIVGRLHRARRRVRATLAEEVGEVLTDDPRPRER